MERKRIRIALGLLLVVTLLVTWAAPDPVQDGGGLVLAVERQVDRPPLAVAQPMEAAHASPSNGSDVLTIRARHESGATVRLFAQVLKPVPIPPPSLPTPEIPPAPVAPPLPFRVLGRYLEGGVEAVFLQHNDMHLVVRAGDTVAYQYKVESISGSILTLRHLPSDQLQSLSLGNWN